MTRTTESSGSRFACDRRGRETCGTAALAAAITAAMLWTAPAMAGCNSGDNAEDATIDGPSCRALGRGTGTLGVGQFAVASGTYTTALGYRSGYSATDKDGATALGAWTGNNGTADWSVAIGAGNASANAAQATGVYSIAIGAGNHALLGGNRFDGAQSSGFAAIAMGVSAKASGTAALALGSFTTASGLVSLAFGDLSRATGAESMALGRNSTSDASYAVALGSATLAHGAQSVALGYNSKANIAYSIAIGANANATQVSAVAIGRNSVANVANTVSVGASNIKRRIVNLAPGTQPSDAVTLAQVQALIAAADKAKPAKAAATQDEVEALRALVKAQQESLDQVRAELAAIKGNAAMARLAAAR